MSTIHDAGIAKAWGHVTTDGAGASTDVDVFGCSSALVSTILEVTLSQAIRRTSCVMTSAFGPTYPLGTLVAWLGGGAFASLTTFASPKVTVTGLNHVTPDLVGTQITISGAATGANNGTFQITDYVSTTSLKFANTGGVAPDANNGGITWSLSHNRSFTLLQYRTSDEVYKPSSANAQDIRFAVYGG